MKTKQSTVIFSCIIIIVLNLKEFYETNPLPNSKEKEKLEKQTEITTEQVSRWFKNRRKIDNNIFQ